MPNLLHITRIDRSLPMPNYQTQGAVAFDLYSRLSLSVEPHTIAKIPSNLIIKVPKNLALLVVSRSSGPEKFGLMIANGIGVIDQDYYGPEDEIKILVYNFTDKISRIKKGDRIAQALLVSIAKAKIAEKNILKSKSRGGFGTTGHQ